MLVSLGLAVMTPALVFAPVAEASTSNTTLSTSATQLNPNQQVTLTATVTTSTGSTPGTVQFSAQSATIPGCGAVSVSSSTATCTTSFSQPGSYGLQAYYSGDFTFGSWSTSNQVNVTVAGVQTTVTLGSSLSSPATGTTFTLTATVAGAPGDSTPFQGSVEFMDAGAPVNGCAMTGVDGHTGQAQCQLRFATPGSHSFVARYLGDQHWAPSDSSVLALTVRRAGSGALPTCAGQDTVFTQSHLGVARTALLCLVNAIRGRYGLDPLSESPELDAHAQAHPGQGWAPPGARVYGGSALFDASGPSTPYGVVAAWMRGRQSCFDLLSPRDEAGFGVVGHPVIVDQPQAGAPPSFAYSPAWTALLLATKRGASANQLAAEACPHRLPVDSAGQGKPPHPAISDLLVALASHRGSTLKLLLVGQVRRPFAARLTISVPGAASRTVLVHGPTRAHRTVLSIDFGRGALHGTALVKVLVGETVPKKATYEFALRL